jgi:hypothetical protein
VRFSPQEREGFVAFAPLQFLLGRFRIIRKLMFSQAQTLMIREPFPKLSQRSLKGDRI